MENVEFTIWKDFLQALQDEMEADSYSAHVANQMEQKVIYETEGTSKWNYS